MGAVGHGYIVVRYEFVAGPPGLPLGARACCSGSSGGGASWVLLRLIALLSNLALLHRSGWQLPSFAHYQPGWWLVPTAMAGGLVVSLLAQWAPVIRGHGIPEAMEAVLVRQQPDRAARRAGEAAVGRDRDRDRRAVRRRGADHRHRRRARVAARPGAPRLAGRAQDPARLAARRPACRRPSARRSRPWCWRSSCCCSSSRPRAFVPLVVAASVAAGVQSALFGTGPLFAVPAHDFSGLAELPVFVLLGLACGLLAAVVCKGLVRGRGGVSPAPGRRILASGDRRARCSRASASLVPRALGVGYDAISDVLADRLAVGTLAALAHRQVASRGGSRSAPAPRVARSRRSCWSAARSAACSAARVRRVGPASRIARARSRWWRWPRRSGRRRAPRSPRSCSRSS